MANLRIVLCIAVLSTDLFPGRLRGISLGIGYVRPYKCSNTAHVNSNITGIRSIPLIAASSIFAIVAGVVISKTGEYQALMILGNTMVCVGSALIYTLHVGSTASEWIGYQVLAGVGLGLSMQIAVIVSQGVVNPADLSEASAMALFFQLLGGAIFVSVAQSLFTNKLISSLASNVGGVEPSAVVSAGATELRRLLNGEQL